MWVGCLHDNARVFALPRRRRQDGWTSTPGARRSVCLTTPIAGLSRCGYLGFVLGLAFGVAYGFALGSTYHECDKRQPRLTTNGSTRQHVLMPGCTLWLSTGVRTDGRLHPGPAGSDCLNNAPSSSRALSWRPCDRGVPSRRCPWFLARS